jgi:hypothetical protein
MDNQGFESRKRKRFFSSPIVRTDSGPTPPLLAEYGRSFPGFILTTHLHTVPSITSSRPYALTARTQTTLPLLYRDDIQNEHIKASVRSGGTVMPRSIKTHFRCSSIIDSVSLLTPTALGKYIYVNPDGVNYTPFNLQSSVSCDGSSLSLVYFCSLHTGSTYIFWLFVFW